MRLITYIGILSITGNVACFFWVPNRYTAPYWSYDTRITMQRISSIDIFTDIAAQNNDSIDYHSINNNLTIYQTIESGFFLETTIPTTSINFKTKQEPFICQKGGICYGNSTILYGWAINYDRIPYIDFIDCMIRTGCILPAHLPLKYPSHTESLYGYHEWGVPGAIDIAIGLCEWILCGVHTSICFLRNTPLIWHIEPYFKADHLVRGLSCWIGYSYTGSNKRTTDTPFFFDNAAWNMHTIHYGIEFECIQYEFPLHPRIGAYYNQCIGGDNIFTQNHGGITAGLDIIW